MSQHAKLEKTTQTAIANDHYFFQNNTSIFVLTNNLDLIFLLLKQFLINFAVESLTNLKFAA